MQFTFAKLLQLHLWSTKSEVSTHAFTLAYCSTPFFSKVDTPSLAFDPIFYFLIAMETIIAIPVEEGAAMGVWLASADVQPKDMGGY